MLQPGEEIVEVWHVADEKRVKGLKFGTSMSAYLHINKSRVLTIFIYLERQSSWYGTPAEDAKLWKRNGAALEGFHGAAEDAIFGLAVRRSPTRHVIYLAQAS